MVHATHEVVLVEDDGGMRQAVTRMLNGGGYRVRAFDSAEALLAALSGERTVKAHRAHVMEKLHVRSVAELVHVAVKLETDAVPEAIPAVA